jgi:hypothetical protein
VGGRGAPAPFEVLRVTDCTIRNFALRDLHMDVSPAVTSWCQASQALGVDLRGLTGRFGHSAVVAQYIRGVTMSTLRATKIGSVIRGSMVAGAATGSTDVLIEDVAVDGRYPTMIHLHEGVARCTVRGVTMHTRGDPSVASDGGVSVRARSYDTQIVECGLVGGTGNGVLHVDDTCTTGGLIAGNALRAVAARSDGWLLGRGWRFENNVCATGFVVDQNRNHVGKNKGLSTVPLPRSGPRLDGI